MNPEKYGWHWVNDRRAEWQFTFWYAAHLDGHTSRWAAERGWTYGGPILTSAEHAVRVAQAQHEVRELCAAHTERLDEEDEFGGRVWPDGIDIAEELRALPLPANQEAPGG
jgi:hypothetical protein